MSDPTMADVLARLGRPFAVFDDRTQDSGHVSYGIEANDGRRLFVKTPGTPHDSPGGTTQSQRASLLRHATRLHQEVTHPALIALRDVVDVSDGVVVIYDWFDGELLHCPPDRRGDPDEAHNRFKSLPAAEIVAALDQVISLHSELERAGWVGGDFYDGCLMYDFAERQIKVMDFECYRRGHYVNDEGRLPGSSRFMAPEEFQLDATIDSRTTVFNLGRMVDLFLLAHNESPEARALVDEATAATPDQRPPNVASLHQRWVHAISRGRRRLPVPPGQPYVGP
jgi:serine/threonine-protein kinase